MIRIGLGIRTKEKIINDYIKENGIKKVFVLYAKEQEQKLRISIEYETVEYDEWEMYRTFYPMIEKVDADTLIVVNDALRTTSYSDLKVNCATVWLNQTPHRIIFNHFPFIEDKEDFRILQKLDQGSKWVDKFDYTMLQTQDILVSPVKISITPINVQTTDAQKASYEKLKEREAKLIEENPSMDPNNLPRKLALKAGDFKKSAINPNDFYLARNKRFKLDNVDSFKSYKNKDYTLIDMPISRKELIDYLMKTKNYNLKYICTDLSIDKYLMKDFIEWKARLDAFYVKANIYK